MFRFAVSNWNEKLSKWITKKQVLSEIEDWSKTDKSHLYTKITLMNTDGYGTETIYRTYERFIKFLIRKMEYEKKKHKKGNGKWSESLLHICSKVEIHFGPSRRTQFKKWLFMRVHKKALKFKCDTFVWDSSFQFSWMLYFHFRPFSLSQSRHSNDKLCHLIDSNWKNHFDLWNIRARKWFKNRLIIIIIIFLGFFKSKLIIILSFFLFCFWIYRSRGAIITTDAYNNWHTKRWKWTRCFGRGKTR